LETKTKVKIEGEVAMEDRDENENEWGVTNDRITHIRVGHSPPGENDKELEGLARCSRAVMPRLEKIRADSYPSDICAVGEGTGDVGGDVKSVYAYILFVSFLLYLL
jgi:hypothetical protein